MQTNSRSCVVTGASTGIGLAVATRFLEDGWNVVGLSRSAEKLNNARESLSDLGELHCVQGEPVGESHSCCLVVPTLNPACGPWWRCGRRSCFLLSMRFGGGCRLS